MSKSQLKRIEAQKKPYDTVQDQGRNWRDEEGRLFLLRCYVCEPEYGLENWAFNVAHGICAWCGWGKK